MAAPRPSTKIAMASGGTPFALAGPFDYELFLLGEGAKSLVKKEKTPLAEAPAICRWLAEQGLHGEFDEALRYQAGTRDDLGYRAEGGLVTLFIARDAEVARRACELGRCEVRIDEVSRAEAVAAMGELGSLLGYPECCVAAYLAGPNAPFFPRGTAGFHLDAYHRTVGAFHPLLNRLVSAFEPYLSHSPCSYNCAASIAIAERVHREVERVAPEAAARHLELLRQPVLFWSAETSVRFDGRFEGGAIAYRGFTPSRSAEGDEPFARFVEALGLGDAVALRDGAAQVMKDGRVLVEALDLEPLAFPFLFNWDDGFFPYRRRPRVALLDLHTTDHDFFANPLPLIGGDFLRLGIETDLHRLVVDHSETDEARGRAAALEAHLVERQVSLVVASKSLSPTLMERLGQLGIRRALLQARGNEPPGTVDHVLGSGDPGSGDGDRDHHRRAVLRRLLPLLQDPPQRAPSRSTPPGAPPSLAADLATERPPFRPILEYEAFDEAPPPPMVQWLFEANNGCPYSQPYSEADAGYLPQARDGLTMRGCNFCDMGGDYRKVEPPAALARRLTDEMAHVVRASGGSVRRLVIGDTYPHPYLEKLVDGLAAEGVRRVELLVQTRPDWLLKSHDKLTRILPQLRDRESQLVLYLIGFENFSQAELDRMDKGLTVEQNLRALELLRSLEREHPESFSATRYRSHGFLLFNPWTTLDDLEANAAVLRATAFHEFRSHYVLTRPRLPLYHKALRDGLLVEAYDVAAKSSSRRIGYAPEYPWRSQSPAVERVFEIVAAHHEAVAAEDHADLLAAAVRFVRESRAEEQPAEEACAAFAPELARFRPLAPPPPLDSAPDGAASGPPTEVTSERVDAALAAELHAAEKQVWSLVNDGKPADALALCRALAGLHPALDRVQELLARVEVLARFEDAAHLLEAKQFLDAERLYRDICELVPNHPEGYRGLARALLGQGRKLQAVQVYARYQQEIGRKRSRPEPA